MVEPYHSFWEEVQVVGSCWIWGGRSTKEGFGRVYTKPFKGRLAHLVALDSLAIPTNTSIRHKCRNKHCVRPGHLTLSEEEAVLWRFLGEVLVGDGCWEWQGSCLKGKWNYGMLGTPSSGLIRAHRYSYKLFMEDPGDAFVLHKCDNPPCVRPDHLFLGDALVNAQDCSSKGRNHLGESCGTSVLTELEVRDARTQHKKGSGVRPLARKYGVAPATMYEVLTWKTWKHVE